MPQDLPSCIREHMSTTEILDELPKLTTDVLQRIQQRILDVEDERELVPGDAFRAGIAEGLRSLETEPMMDSAAVRRKISGWAGRSV